MTQQIDPAKALELCLLETECKEDGYHSVGGDNPRNPASSDCPSCRGTGRVPLLDPQRVQVECPAPSGHLSWCRCQGSGWVPSTDPWAYASAMVLAFPNEDCSIDLLPQVDAQGRVTWVAEMLDRAATGETPGLAAFYVVHEALVVEGWALRT